MPCIGVNQSLVHTKISVLFRVLFCCKCKHSDVCAPLSLTVTMYIASQAVKGGIQLAC